MNQTIDLAEAARAWARGNLPMTAGVELLIRTGFTIYEGAPWITRDGNLAAIDTGILLDRTGGKSGGEQRIVEIAASLIGGELVNLNDVIPGLDYGLSAHVLAAIAWAAGTHEASEFVYDDNTGQPAGFRKLPSLYEWPETAK